MGLPGAAERAGRLGQARAAEFLGGLFTTTRALRPYRNAAEA